MPFGSGFITEMHTSCPQWESFRSCLNGLFWRVLCHLGWTLATQDLYLILLFRAFQVSIKCATPQWFEPCGFSITLSWGSPVPYPMCKLTSRCPLRMWDLHWTCNSAAKTKALQCCGDCWALPSPGCAQRNGTRAQTELISPFVEENSLW